MGGVRSAEDFEGGERETRGFVFDGEGSDVEVLGCGRERDERGGLEAGKRVMEGLDG